MVIKQKKRNIFEMLLAPLLVLSAGAVVTAIRGIGFLPYAAALFSVPLITSVWDLFVYARTFVLTDEGVEIRFLFIKKKYLWEELVIKSEETADEPLSRRGKGYLYGSTASASHGVSTSGSYLSPHTIVDAKEPQKALEVLFYKKTSREKAPSALYCSFHPFSTGRIFLLGYDCRMAWNHTASKTDFINTLSGFGIKL